MSGFFRSPFVRFVIILGLAGQLLAGCAPPPPVFKPDIRQGVALFREGETLFQKREYAQAAVKLEQALHHLPDNIDLILRCGEVFEHIDQPNKAAAIYRRSLTLDHRRRNEIIYHLARLELYVFDHPEQALKLQKELPSWDWRTVDLKAGRLFLVENQTRDALHLFLGLTRRLDKSSDSAWPWYHAALALKHLNDLDGTTRALLNAIDRSNHRGLDRRIELFWSTFRPREN